MVTRRSSRRPQPVLTAPTMPAVTDFESTLQLIPIDHFCQLGPAVSFKKSLAKKRGQNPRSRDLSHRCGGLCGNLVQAPGLIDLLNAHYRDTQATRSTAPQAARDRPGDREKRCLTFVHYWRYKGFRLYNLMSTQRFKVKFQAVASRPSVTFQD